MTDTDDDRALVDDDGRPSKWEPGGCVSSTARQANWSTTTPPGTGVGLGGVYYGAGDSIWCRWWSECPVRVKAALSG